MEKESFEDSFKYKNWRRRLEDNRIDIRSVRDAYTRHGKDGDVLYTLVEIDARTPDGNALTPLCFVKGDAVSMVVVLIDGQTGEKFVLMVRQRRVSDGSETYEHPAGMIDEGETPIEVAARELKEETGLDVSTGELVELSSKPWFSATATSDERLSFFYCERRMPGADIRAMHGRRTGKASENEQTRLHVASLPEAHRLVSNLHGVLGHLLYLQAVGDYDTMKRL
ncbi:NUDIX hydrolase [Larkinella soli]|uniref:NUDIX hydrolase n=1 Tax=Larkinella soli TaxID=1770527 RepID=UPI000FFBF06F|nr:NUDIX hydrolase [Larkinella soli]